MFLDGGGYNWEPRPQLPMPTWWQAMKMFTAMQLLYSALFLVNEEEFSEFINNAQKYLYDERIQKYIEFNRAKRQINK